MTDTTALAQQLATIEATIDQLATQAADIRQRILDTTPPGTTITAPDGTPLYKVRAGARRYNQAAALAGLPPETITAATTTTTAVDPKLLKAIVPPALWDTICTKQGAPTLARA
jgi:hypothetical protein